MKDFKALMDEYLRRNLVHAKSVGVLYGIKTIVDRLDKQKRKPKWMMNILNREMIKANVVAHEIAAHRDEIKIHLTGEKI